MEKNHSELLKQFSEKGYSIESGMDSVPQGLRPGGRSMPDSVKSSARPMSNEKIKGQWISKIRYKIEQYFGFLPGGVNRTSHERWEGFRLVEPTPWRPRFTTLLKEHWICHLDRFCQVMAFNAKRPLAHRADGPEGFY